MKLVNVLSALLLAGAAVFGFMWWQRVGTGETVAPVAVASSRPVPREGVELVVDEPTHFFGSMATHELRNHTFVLKNEGTETLELQGGGVTCKCTSFKIDGLESDADNPTVVEVPAGETVDIYLEWHPTASKPEFRQTAAIYTNDPKLPTIKLAVTGRVDHLFSVLPEGTWGFADISGSEVSETSGVVFTTVKDNFRFSMLNCPHPNITLEPRELSADDLARPEVEGAKFGYEIVVKLEPGVPVGLFSTVLQFAINEDPADDPFTIELVGNYTGPVSIQSRDTSFKPDLSLLSLGEFLSEEGASKELFVYIEGKDEELDDFEVTDIITTPEFMEVEFERVESYKVLGKRQFKMNVNVPPGAPRKTFFADNPASVKIKTSLSNVPELNIDVRFSVQ